MTAKSSVLPGGAAEPSRNLPPCPVARLAALLEEEPRLEAVAFNPATRRLSIATLGGDKDGYLARRVTETMLSSHEPCPHFRPERCEVCGVSAEHLPGRSRILVSEKLGTTVVRKATCVTAVSLWQWIKIVWPAYAPRQKGTIEEHSEVEWKPMAALAAGCAVFGLAGWALEFAPVPAWAPLAAYIAAYLCGGWDAAVDAWDRLKHGQLDIHFLMLAVAAGAAAIGAWREGTLLLFLFSASGAMEHYAMGRTRREIGALLRGAPKTAMVLEGGREREIPVDDLLPGMTVRVTAGGQIPVDLVVTRGQSECDESNLTGESVPVPKGPGDTALAGTINIGGILEGKVLRPASESSLQRIIRMIREAQSLRAPSQTFTDRFGTTYTWTILGACALMFCIWWLVLGLPPFASDGETRSAFYRAMTLLVVASPCALVLSVPSGILSAIASGARRGVLFRGGAPIENLALVNVVALDKTGTLTSGRLTLAGVDVLRGTEEGLLSLAHSLARHSSHPLSRAITRTAAQRGAGDRGADEHSTVAGRGVRARIGGKSCVLGNRAFVAGETGLQLPDAPHGADAAEVWVAGPDEAGCLRFRDEIRPQSRALLEQLKARGIAAVMLTGDREGPATAMGRAAGIEEIRAGLLPQDKVAAIEELKDGGRRRVAMVGDGVNDAPCLAAADIGVAMGARGSDAALEQAEVVLMNDKLENFILALDLSTNARRVIRQNMFVALGTVTVMVLATFVFPVPLALGVAAHEGSTVVVVLNSLRLLFMRRA
ncbi:MAG: cation-translocating P-type ATPase [Chthoniobacterales bacterium]|nr:cation-translocating P-type ATPase [Chthoniobacterales bacterium]